MNIGLIGCGRIAGFHAEAIKAAGAEIVSVAYRSDRNKALEFARQYDIGCVYPDWREMIDSEKPDAIWVLASWDTIDELLLPVLEMGLPVFFEKPVALSSSRIINAIHSFPGMLDAVQVGYNRRFYSVVNTLREYLSVSKVIHAEVFIPESVPLNDASLVRYRTLQNSSHVIDLFLYIFGITAPGIQTKSNIKQSGTVTPGFTAVLDSGFGFSIYLSSVFNSPINTSLRIYTDDERIFELKPLERLNIYQGFDITGPSAEQPVRLYNPRIIHTQYEDAGRFKPGFFEQTEAFLRNTFMRNNESLPNLQSALRVTGLIEQLTKE